MDSSNLQHSGIGGRSKQAKANHSETMISKIPSKTEAEVKAEGENAGIWDGCHSHRVVIGLSYPRHSLRLNSASISGIKLKTSNAGIYDPAAHTSHHIIKPSSDPPLPSLCSLTLPSLLVNMGRMHSKGKGMSSSALPYRRAPPSWLKATPEEVCNKIFKLARKGLTPSQIGVSLRDSEGVAQVRFVTGNKILRILKSEGLAPEIPEDLYHLIVSKREEDRGRKRCEGLGRIDEQLGRWN